MRIPWIATTTIWLAGIVAADYLTFVATSFGDTGKAAVIQSGNWGKPFNWTTSESLTVQSVTLYTMDNLTNETTELATASNQSPVAGPSASNAESMPAPIPAADDTSRLSMHIHNRQPDGPPGGPSSTLSTSPGATAAPSGAPNQMTITNSGSTGGFVMINQISDFADKTQLYFMASWTGSNNTSGQSYSRYFEICNATCNQDETESVYLSTAPALPETILPLSPSGSTTTLPTEPSSSISGPGGPSPSSGSSSSSSSSKKSGLSTGAVAGIAVACGIVGLALIGVLFWFLFRRRRDTTGMSPLPYGHERNRTRELMAEKEGNGGAENAPHSPYSDDGPQPHDGSVGGGGGVDVAAARYDPAYQHEDHHALERSFTPYSEHMGSVSPPPPHMAPLVHADHDDTADSARHPDAHGGDSESSGLRPQTPRALTTPYAHLIEEGMTEEEIRRVEEEERQLDAEIERAGRRD